MSCRSSALLQPVSPLSPGTAQIAVTSPPPDRGIGQGSTNASLQPSPPTSLPRLRFGVPLFVSLILLALLVAVAFMVVLW